MRGRSNEYHFLTRWRVQATPEEVYDIIAHPLQFPRWWPSVYLSATEIEPGDGTGVGRCVRFHTKGRLPYTLDWESRTVEAKRPNLIAIRARGDFDGRGIWRFEQSGSFVDITFDWELKADKPLLRRLSWLFKSVFAANHRWAMARGLECLKTEIAHRRTQSRRANG
jgi:uncharacterized protein YndB with AHSA1/START domain